MLNKITHRNDFYKLFDSNIKIGAELGVAGGGFSDILVNTHNFENFFCIDKWNDHHNEKERQKVITRFAGKTNVNIVQKTFSEAALDFEDEFFDFLYIDGYAHTGQNSGLTLLEWYPKLRIGGIFAGHDYHEKWMPTKKIVDLFSKCLGKSLSLTEGDVFPSWYFLK
jgi:hypothetical protein